MHDVHCTLCLSRNIPRGLYVNMYIVFVFMFVFVYNCICLQVFVNKKYPSWSMCKHVHCVCGYVCVFCLCLCSQVFVKKYPSWTTSRGLYVNTHIVFVDVGVPPLRLPLTGTHYPAPPTTITIVEHAYTIAQSAYKHKAINSTYITL